MGAMQRMNRKRLISPALQQAETVWVALTGAKFCQVCRRYRLSGRLIGSKLYCDECDSRLHFPWPETAVNWHA
jgi:molybdenum cofactor biosynthesis enzyme MoaA